MPLSLPYRTTDLLRQQRTYLSADHSNKSHDPTLGRQLMKEVMDLENAKAQMRKGVLELCILAIAAEEEVYPNDIIARLKSNDLIVVEGTLYPLLTRLKNDGLLEYSWRESSSGPPRKYFKTTTDGQSFLTDLTMSWEKLVQSVALTLGKGEMTSAESPQTEVSDEPPASTFFDE